MPKVSFNCKDIMVKNQDKMMNNQEKLKYSLEKVMSKLRVNINDGSSENRNCTVPQDGGQIPSARIVIIFPRISLVGAILKISFKQNLQFLNLIFSFNTGI